MSAADAASPASGRLVPGLTALVLAAGEGRRYDPSGRRWKLVEPLPDGRPVVRASCGNLLGVVDEIVVVCGSHEADLAAALAGLPLRFVRCPDAAAGMGASLKCGVRASQPALGWLLVLADMPFVAATTLRAIGERLSAGAQIVRPSFDGRPGHPVGFAALLREPLLAIGDEAGAAELVRSLADRLVVLPVDDAGCVRDIDRPADLPQAAPVGGRRDAPLTPDEAPGSLPGQALSSAVRRRSPGARAPLLRQASKPMIISSLLDTDLYKFTMMQSVLHQFPGAQAEYRFRCRTPDIDLRPYVPAIEEELGHLFELRFTEAELQYLRGLRFIKSDFVDFLGLFQFNQKYITVAPSPKDNGEIDITIRGPWLHTIMFEIPVLAIVNEIWFRETVAEPDYEEGRRRLDEKLALITGHPDLRGMKIADYGTRRRFSKRWHEEVLLTAGAKLGDHLAGTSNVHFAMKHGLIPLGTMAHEYLQAAQALGPRLRDSQTFALEMWAREYRGDLGIALSDVYGFDAFLRDFDMYFCKLFDGARHDSGDPFDWGERLIEHYEKNRVDPKSKTLVFSDALTFPLMVDLYQRFRGRAKLSFGIGTNLTNDLGYQPLQIVIKMVRCNGQPVAKLSDAPEKTMCDDLAYLNYLRQVFGIAS